MTEALSILTSIAFVLVTGLIATIISKKFKISNVLLLILIGIILEKIRYNGEAVFDFSPTFLVSISILALALITFDGSSRFKLKEVDKFSGTSARLVLWFVITNGILLTIFTNVLFFPEFTTKYVIFSLIFSFIMAGTDPGAIFSMMKDKTSKVIEILELESIINTPVIVLMPFILLDFLSSTSNGQLVQTFMDQLIPFLRQIIVGVGSGVIIGIIVFKSMKNFYHDQLSPLAIITAALLSYVLAENIGGNGVLSVATMGLVFGNIYVKKKVRLQDFSSIFSNALEIFVFVLIGFLIKIELTPIFFAKSLGLFGIMILARWLAIAISLNKTNFKLREKLFMTLNIPKGIAVAAVVFSLSVRNIEGIAIIIDLVLIFMIYSLILSSIVDRFSKKFIRIELEDGLIETKK